MLGFEIPFALIFFEVTSLWEQSQKKLLQNKSRTKIQAE